MSYAELYDTETAAAAEPPAAEKTNAIAAGIVSVQGEVAKFDQIAAGLAAIEAAHPKNVIIVGMETPAGMKLAEGAWRAYRNPRLEVERARKAAKAPVLALGKAIDTFAGSLEDRLRAGEDHYGAQIDAEKTRRAEVEAEAARVEAARKEKHRSGIANICCYLDRCHAPGMTSARIAIGMEALQAMTFGPEWEDFAVQAADAQCRTLDAMRALHAQAVTREAEKTEADRLRALADAQAEELAQLRAREAARVAAEAAAAARAESERLERLARIEAEVEAETKALNAEAEALGVRLPGAYDAEDYSITIGLTGSTEPKEFTEAPEPTGEWKAVTPGAGNAETAPDTTTASPRVGAMGAGQAAAAAPAADASTLVIGTINKRLGFIVNESFMAVLGFSRQDRPGKGMHYLMSDWPAIKRALARYVESLPE